MELTLTHKTPLTHDVWDLTYATSTPLSLMPGQFLLCDCDARQSRLKRSYSVSWAARDTVSLLIKRLPEGKGGSVAICDQEIGHVMQVWGPMGQFVLQDTSCPKVFIGTGTGFAPLYFMMRSVLGQESMLPGSIFFLFGVRELRDMFYLDQLEYWRRNHDFDYEIFCSRESASLPEKHNPGRVTQYLTPEQVSRMNHTGESEFYICGSPVMVTEVRDILSLHGISKEKVFFEQY